MHLMDWLLLAFLVAMVVELAWEIKRKRYGAAVTSAIVVAILLVVCQNILVYLWRQMTGGGP